MCQVPDYFIHSLQKILILKEGKQKFRGALEMKGIPKPRWNTSRYGLEPSPRPATSFHASLKMLSQAD